MPWTGQDLVCWIFGAPNLSRLPPAGLALYGALITGLLLLLAVNRRRFASDVSATGGDFVLLGSALMIAADKLPLMEMEVWYRTPVILSSSIVCAALLRGRRKLSAAVIVLFAASGALRVPAGVAAARSNPSSYAPYRLQAAEWIGRNTPPGARIGSWNAGMLGYFSGRSVVNLDGLVNDRSYFERVIRRGELEGYLSAEGIDWLADQACGPDPSPLAYLRRTGSERLMREFDLAAALVHPDSRDGCPGYGIWHRRPGGQLMVGGSPGLEKLE